MFFVVVIIVVNILNTALCPIKETVVSPHSKEIPLTFHLINLCTSISFDQAFLLYFSTVFIHVIIGNH